MTRTFTACRNVFSLWVLLAAVGGWRAAAAVAARHEHAVLRSGALRVVHAEGPVLVLERNADPVGFEGSPLSLEPGAARRLLVVTNTSDSPARVQVRLDGVADVSRLTWEGITATAALLGDGTVAIDLPPVSGAIFQIR